MCTTMDLSFTMFCGIHICQIIANIALKTTEDEIATILLRQQEPLRLKLRSPLLRLSTGIVVHARVLSYITDYAECFAI